MQVAPLLLIFLAIAVVRFLVVAFMQRKRREEILPWAAAEGLRYAPGRNREIHRRFAAFECFQTGYARYAQHVCEGVRDGMPVAAFDFHYRTRPGGGNSSSTQEHDFSAVVIETGLPLKPLTLRAENALDRLGELAGFDDIDFESTAFSDRFHVTSPDRRWAHDVLHQATMEFLLEAPMFTIEMAGPWVLARRSRRLSPSEFSAALAVLEGILERLPRYLHREWKGVDA